MTKENVELVQAGNLVESNMLQYSAYVLLHRAIPDLRDGLKPVYRRILFTMWSEKITRFSKSANVTGKVMLVHPHGDTYGTVVGMAQKDKHMNPFIESKGNFGSYLTNGIAPAAARYTEIKLGDYALSMMKDISKGSVPLIDNYDSTIKMPEVMPTRFPTILEFSQSGIGVGFGSSTLGMNTSELADALIKYLRTGKHTILVPDFPSGGFILNEPDQFEKINKEGRGTVRIRSNHTIDNLTISITEIPYGAKRDKIMKKIIELAKTDKLREIAEVKDLTGIKGQKIVIRAKRGTDMKLLMEKLYRHTDLESTMSANMNIIINQLPRVLSVEKVIEEWIEWRRSVIITEYQNELSKTQASLNRMYALKKILDHIEELIEIIRHTPDGKIESAVSKRFGVDLEQAEYIANMKLRSISYENIQLQIQKISKLEEDLISIQDMIDNKETQNKKMIEDFKIHKKNFGKPRRSQIIETPKYSTEARKIESSKSSADLSKQVTVHFSKDGYMFVGDKDPVLKPGDEIDWVEETTLGDRILVYSKNCIIYNIKVRDLKDMKEKPRGTYVGEFFRNDSVDPITSTLESKFDLMVYLYEDRYAIVSKKVFGSTQSKIKLAWNEKFKLVSVVPVKNDGKVIAELENGKILTITATEKDAKNSRIAQGVFTPNKKKIVRVN